MKKLLTTTLCLVFMAAAAFAEHVPGEIIVVYKSADSVPASVKSLRTASVTSVGRFAQSKTRLIRLADGVGEEEALAKVKADPNVEDAFLNNIAHAAGYPNDPIYEGYRYFFSGNWYVEFDQWALAKIKANRAWWITGGSASVPVAVVDSGIDMNHEDLKNKIWTNPGEIPGNNKDDDKNGYVDDVHGWNFVAGNNDPNDNSQPSHGTMVASVIGAQTNNGIGMAGVTWHSPIVPVRIFGAAGNASDANISNGIRYAADNGVRIINLSLSGTSTLSATKSAIDYAWGKGCICICASGNNNISAATYPGSYANTVAVGAINKDDKRSTISNGWHVNQGSNYGSYLKLCAPGTAISTAGTLNINGTIYPFPYTNGAEGTSIAAAFVSGVAALVLSVHPEFSAKALYKTLIASADDVESAGFDNYTGYGRINAEKAVYYNDFNLADIKKKDLNSAVYAENLVLSTTSGEISGALYAQTLDGANGIMISTTKTGFTEGQIISVEGTLVNKNGNLAVNATDVTKLSNGTKPAVRYMPGKSLGGGAYGTQGGVVDDTRTGKKAAGVNNIGLLVRTTGKVVKRGTNFFYIDDGSRLYDGTNNGIYVKTKNGITVPQLNRRVSVTGISTCETVTGGNRRILLVRRAADIRTL
ncbi:MAG: S8 family serine peptidase [Abditibacteriota bacterium]|nr:S8 family serine peptidase [Abditibacteriota bacterium]